MFLFNFVLWTQSFYIIYRKWLKQLLEMNYTDKQIESLVKEWVCSKIDDKFEFREYQLECIVRVIKNILDHNYQNYIIEAPTGSGKSLINIISAGVLAEYFDLT